MHSDGTVKIIDRYTQHGRNQGRGGILEVVQSRSLTGTYNMRGIRGGGVFWRCYSQDHRQLQTKKAESWGYCVDGTVKIIDIRGGGGGIV